MACWAAMPTAGLPVRTDRNVEAISLLLAAYDYSADADTDPWQFALSARELAGAGLTVTDLRWLVLKNFALLARETTTPGDAHRQFRPIPFTALTPSACVVLTPEGAVQLRAKYGQTDSSDAGTYTDATNISGSTSSKPHWDAGRRELLLGDVVVKRFRVPAANQELVLQAFEEEGWPHSIDDPLPPMPEMDTQQRLRATIKSLNRSQQTPLIRFHANGGGEVVCWDFTAGQAGSVAARS